MSCTFDNRDRMVIVGVRDMPLVVGVITCWYRNISMGNYGYNLISVLREHRFITVKILSAPCACAYERLVGQNRNFPNGNFEFITFPPYLNALPKRKIGKIFNEIVQASLHLLRGIVYLSKCDKCEIIHYQQSAFSLGIFPLIPIMFIPTSNKKIVTVHSFPSGVPKTIPTITYKRADKVIVHSQEMMRKLSSSGVDETRIAIIPHGARIPRLMSFKRDKVSFFGAPTKEKGAFLLLDALKILKERDEKIIVDFYGVCKPSEKEAFLAEATRLQIDDCVRWGGRLSEDEFDMKMQESKFTFAIYQVLISGSSILTRAIANGTPVIATNIGGAPEYSKSLVLVPPDDSHAVADAISKLAQDETLRRQLSEAARKDAMRISWDVIAGKTLRVYLDTLR